MKIVLYCRSSIDSQEHSIDMQKSMAYETAVRRSLLIDTIYEDSAVSARKTELHERPALDRLWRDIERGDVKTLLVYKRDRLARKVAEHLDIYEYLKKHNIEVIFTARNELPMQYTPAGEFFELIIAGFNEEEARKIAAGVQATKESLFKNGKNHSGRLPFGYYSDKHKVLQQKPTQVATVKKVFNQLCQDEWQSFPDFIRELEENGTIIPNKRNYQKLKKMITTPEYKGVRKAKFLDELMMLEQKRLAIISEEQWNTANTILDSLITTRESGIPKEDELLYGLVFCSKCDTQAKRRKRAVVGELKSIMYVCPFHSTNKVAQRNLEESLFGHVTKWIHAIAFSEQSIMFQEALLTWSHVCKRKLAELDSQIKITTEKVLRLTESWTLDKDSATQEEMMETYAKLCSIESEKRRHVDFLSYLANYPTKVEALWKKLSIRESFVGMHHKQKAELLNDVVKKILIGPDFTVQIELKNPFFDMVKISEGEMQLAVNVLN